MKTTLTIDDDLLTRLRNLMRDQDDPDEHTELTAAVRELLEANPQEGPGRHEYGFAVSLTGVLRTTGRDRRDALGKLLDFQAVELTADHDGVTLTEVSFVPDNVQLIDIDGVEVGDR